MDEQRAEPDIAQLVAEHHRAVFGYAFRLAGSIADAEDLTQLVERLTDRLVSESTTTILLREIGIG